MEIVNETGISEPLEMIKWFTFVKLLPGFNLKKDHEKFLKDNRKYKDMK